MFSKNIRAKVIAGFICIVVLVGIYALSYKSPSQGHFSNYLSLDCPLDSYSLELPLQSLPKIKVGFADYKQASVRLYTSTLADMEKYKIAGGMARCDFLGEEILGKPYLTGQFKIFKTESQQYIDSGYIELPRFEKAEVYYLGFSAPEKSKSDTGIFLNVIQ